MSALRRIRAAVSRQLSRPEGLGGRVIAAAMNRGNDAMNDAAIAALGRVRGLDVVELGFGGGRSVVKLAAAGARVIGVDPAADMVERAKERLAASIEDGTVEIHLGEVGALPLADETVDRVVTVNTIYFWPDLEGGLAEIRRVLRPGGLVVIGIRDGSVMDQVDSAIFTIRSPEEITAAMDEAGLVAHVDSLSDQAVHLIVGKRR